MVGTFSTFQSILFPNVLALEKLAIDLNEGQKSILLKTTKITDIYRYIF